MSKLIDCLNDGPHLITVCGNLQIIDSRCECPKIWKRVPHGEKIWTRYQKLAPQRMIVIPEYHFGEDQIWAKKAETECITFGPHRDGKLEVRKCCKDIAFVHRRSGELRWRRSPCGLGIKERDRIEKFCKESGPHILTRSTNYRVSEYVSNVCLCNTLWEVATGNRKGSHPWNKHILKVRRVGENKFQEIKDVRVSFCATWSLGETLYTLIEGRKKK